jgi:putative addiction module component (TIGR02574 family)
MSVVTLRDVELQALKLSPEERAKLIEVLIASVEPPMPLHPEWEAEIAHRVAELDAGWVRLIDGQDVMAELRARIKVHEREALRRCISTGREQQATRSHRSNADRALEGG